MDKSKYTIYWESIRLVIGIAILFYLGLVCLNNTINRNYIAVFLFIIFICWICLFFHYEFKSKPAITPLSNVQS
jgi:hypothetical protein